MTNTARELAIERRIAEFEPGPRPLLIAASFVEGAHWARVYGIEQGYVVAVGNARALAGHLPTAVLYAPGWYLSRYIAEMADTLAAMVAKRRDIPVHYIIEGRF